MSRVTLPPVMVGNEFGVQPPRLQAAAAAPAPVFNVPVSPVLEGVSFEYEYIKRRFWRNMTAWFQPHKVVMYTVTSFVLLGMITQSALLYWSKRIDLAVPAASVAHYLAIPPLHGPNMAVNSQQLASTMQHIADQPLQLTYGDKVVQVKPDVIRGWVQTVTHRDQGIAYLHVDQAAIKKSLTDLAQPYVTAPMNQVSITHPDGSTAVIATGKNGMSLGDVSSQAQQIADHLLATPGLQLNLPMQVQAFATVTPAAFDKLIEVNVNTKQMYLYDKGQLTHTYPISAGAPATPTPIGQFHIYEKLVVQDMRGFNPNGTPYFQPHVHWINYFLPGGYAVHGNYWRPQSWFGVINSSHGCVSLPDDQAKEVYDWAPIGTTVITHY